MEALHGVSARFRRGGWEVLGMLRFLSVTACRRDAARGSVDSDKTSHDGVKWVSVLILIIRSEVTFLQPVTQL